MESPFYMHTELPIEGGPVQVVERAQQTTRTGTVDDSQHVPISIPCRCEDTLYIPFIRDISSDSNCFLTPIYNGLHNPISLTRALT